MLKQQKVKSQGKTYSLKDYDIENYGYATYSDAPVHDSGEFRKARSMMPFEYLDKTGKDFDWKIYGVDTEFQGKLANAFIVNFDKFRAEGKGLYIHSLIRGSGKTMLACCLLNETVKRYDVSVKFINVLDYLELTKKGYSSMEDKEEKQSILGATVLVLDDIGVEVNKAWIDTTLYQLINFRYSNKLATIITSNLPLEELKVDDRIKDRLNAMCIDLKIPDVSIRGKKAADNNTEFMNSIM